MTRPYYKTPKQEKNYESEQELVFKVVGVVPNIFTPKQKKFITRYYIYGEPTKLKGTRERVVQKAQKVINNFYTKKQLDKFI